MVKRSTWVMVVLLAILAGLAYYLQQPDNLIKKAFTACGNPNHRTARYADIPDRWAG